MFSAAAVIKCQLHNGATWVLLGWQPSLQVMWSLVMWRQATGIWVSILGSDIHKYICLSVGIIHHLITRALIYTCHQATDPHTSTITGCSLGIQTALSDRHAPLNMVLVTMPAGGHAWLTLPLKPTDPITSTEYRTMYIDWPGRPTAIGPIW